MIPPLPVSKEVRRVMGPALLHSSDLQRDFPFFQTLFPFDFLSIESGGKIRTNLLSWLLFLGFLSEFSLIRSASDRFFSDTSSDDWSH